MPFYDFTCRACGKTVELRLTIAELERGEQKCPACGSTELARVYGIGGVVVKGGGDVCPKAKGCPHGAGCGCH